MARGVFMPNMPVDTPIVTGDRPMVEANSPGSNSFTLDALPESHPLRAAKGDLGFDTLPPSRALTHDGKPYILDPERKR